MLPEHFFLHDICVYILNGRHNVATAFILPNRWYNGAESLGRSIGRYTTCGLYLDSQEETAIN